MTETAANVGWKIRFADGSVEPYAGPADMPTDLLPGEFVNMPYGGKPQWFVFSDKQRFWDGTRWQMTGTISPFDPNAMTPEQMYQLRRDILAREGWV